MRYLSPDPTPPDIPVCDGIYFEPEQEVDRTSRHYLAATRLAAPPTKEDREIEEARWAALSGPVTVRRAASR